MKAVTVVPIAKGIFKEHLTYFSGKDIPVGALVSVPVRKKLVDALVVEVRNVESAKSEIKEASFELKKIEKIKRAAVFSDIFLKTIEKMRSYYASSTGHIIEALVPKTFLSDATSLSRENTHTKHVRSNLKQEKLIFQAPLDDRLVFYKTFIRESFARKQSVFICLPTIHEIELFSHALSKGIETYTFVLHSDRGAKELTLLYNQILDETHPVLIIATASFLVVPRHDVSAYIIERESSSAYKQIERPHIDMRVFVELFSMEANKKLILADTFLRIETLFRASEHELGEIAPPIFRLPQGAEVAVIDTKKSEEQDIRPQGKKKFQVITDEALGMIREAVTAKKHIFLFTLRKGLGSVTICNDCGEIFLCDICKSPMKLLRNAAGERTFRCTRCKRSKDTDTSCSHCGSWNLMALGIGTDRVYDELREKFPDVPLFRIDKEITKTDTAARKAMREFKKTKGAILLGTEMTFFYLDEKIDYSVIVSFDSLFSLPSFRIHEKILQLYLALHSFTDKKMIIQTRNSREEIVGAIKHGNALNWYRTEINNRRDTLYPPFTTLMKISYRGTRAEAEKIKPYLEETFKDYRPAVFQTSLPKMKGVYNISAALKIERSHWGGAYLSGSANYDKKLQKILASLGPEANIEIDPEDLM